MAKSEKSIFAPFGIRLQGLSIQQRLPLLICVLLLAVLFTFSIIAYLGLRKSTLHAGSERVQSLSGQLSSMFGQSMQAGLIATAATVQQPSVKEFAASNGMAARAEVVNVLWQVLKDSQTALIEIRDKDHRQLIRVGRDSSRPRMETDQTAMNVSNSSLTPGIGHIMRAGDSLCYPVVIPIEENKKQVGYLVRWKILAASAKAIKQFNELIGTDADMFIANADGTLWTNLRSTIDAPLTLDSTHFKESFQYRNREGRAILASARIIPSTPWMVMTGFSKSMILVPAKSFLRMTLIAGGLILLTGILLAWRMSRNIIRPLDSLTQAAALIAAGQYSKPVPIHRKDEVGNLARAFNAMIVKIQKAKKDMELQLIETKQLNEELRNLSAHLQNIREEERIHIAREMHDELGGLLTGFKMDVAGLQKKFVTSNDPAISEKLDSMKAMTDDAVKFVRKLAAELRPSILDDLGLVPALEWHAKEFEKRYGIPTIFDYVTEDINTSPLVATGLFRIYQESLTNVARHAAANEVFSQLSVTNDVVTLTIKDDGKGFDLNDKSKTLGLLGMKERAVMIGGVLNIDSARGQGTTITIKVPLA